MEANGGLELQVALTCALREEGEQLDIPTALPPRREPPVIVDEHVKCDLQPVWELKDEKKKYVGPSGIELRFSGRPSRSLVITPTGVGQSGTVGYSKLHGAT